MTRKKQQSMTLSDEANSDLERLGRGKKSPWVDASVVGMMAMAREAARVFWRPGGVDDRKVALTAAVAAEFPGTTVLELLIDVFRGREKLNLLTSLRDIPTLRPTEVSAVLVMAYVREVDRDLFDRLLGL